MLFADRRDAGRQLAGALQHLATAPRLTVLGIPRGGVIVAAEVARALHAPLDVYTVRKLGAPEQPELAFGAVATDGTLFLNEFIVRELGLKPGFIARERDAQVREIRRREALYRQGRAPLPLEGNTVIVVDDGIATGATTVATLRAVRKANPRWLVLAVPVGPEETARNLVAECDEALFLYMPELFLAVGHFYERFDQVTDEQVVMALSSAAHVTGIGDPSDV
jgi:predicted phosphoribosyltransferase